MPDEETAEQRRFELLMLDYEMTRDDERTTTSTQATGFGIAVALLAVMIPLLGQACTGGECGEIPPWLIAAAPLAPLCMAGFLAGLGMLSTIRSYYMRALEAELHAYAGRNLADSPVPPASFAGISTEVISLRRGRKSYRVLVFMILFGTIAVFGGITAHLVWNLPSLPRAVAVAVYLPALVLIVAEAAIATLGGRGLFQAALVGYVRRRVQFPDLLRPRPEPARRSLAGYLLLPRPQDTIKWVFLPASFAIGLWAVGADLRADPGPLVRLAAVFVILEYLVYQGRYQWNDIRGLAEDLDHPVPKGRLPVGFERRHLGRNVAASQVVIGVRQVAAVLLALAVGDGLWLTTLALVVAVWGVAVPYELLRDRPVAASRRFRTTGLTVAIWALVGAGYAIRGVTGLHLAGVPGRDPAVPVAVLALVAFGAMFVTLTWTLDAASYFHRDPTRQESDYQPALLGKPHLAALLPYVGARIGRPVAVDPAGVRGRDARPLRGRGRVVAPWNVALLVSCGAGAALGTLLATDRQALGAAAALAGLAAAGVLVAASGPAWRWSAALGTVAVAVLCLWRPLESRSLLLVTPWALFALWFTWFRDQSYQALKDGLRPAVRSLGRLLRLGAAAFVGRRTARLIQLERERRRAGG